PTLQNYQALNQQREQESLRKIEKKTAENLIDISSVRMLDRLQYEHAMERASEYQIILQNIPSSVLQSMSAALPTPAPIATDYRVEEILSKPGLKPEVVAQTSQYMGQIRSALKEGIRVQPVGDIVVPLSALVG
ncbi:hypothetical protein HK102_013372, partial [Quaeritorhiza haematococci]